MLRVGWVWLVMLLGGCQQGGQAAPADGEANSSASAEERSLRPGLYEVTGFESLPGIGTSPERRDRQCIGPDEASHPDRFLVNPGNGCAPGELVQSDNEFRREFRCADGRVLNFTVTFTGDSWTQTITGTSPQGGYEGRTTGQRIGDC